MSKHKITNTEWEVIKKYREHEPTKKVINGLLNIKEDVNKDYEIIIQNETQKYANSFFEKTGSITKITLIILLIIFIAFGMFSKIANQVYEEKLETIKLNHEENCMEDYYREELISSEARKEELESYVKELRQSVTWLQNSILDFESQHPSFEGYFDDILFETDLDFAW